MPDTPTASVARLRLIGLSGCIVACALALTFPRTAVVGYVFVGLIAVWVASSQLSVLEWPRGLGRRPLGQQIAVLAQMARDPYSEKSRTPLARLARWLRLVSVSLTWPAYLLEALRNPRRQPGPHLVASEYLDPTFIHVIQLGGLFALVLFLGSSVSPTAASVAIPVATFFLLGHLCELFSLFVASRSVAQFVRRSVRPPWAVLTSVTISSFATLLFSLGAIAATPGDLRQSISGLPARAVRLMTFDLRSFYTSARQGQGALVDTLTAMSAVLFAAVVVRVARERRNWQRDDSDQLEIAWQMYAIGRFADGLARLGQRSASPNRATLQTKAAGHLGLGELDAAQAYARAIVAIPDQDPAVLNHVGISSKEFGILFTLAETVPITPAVVRRLLLRYISSHPPDHECAIVVSGCIALCDLALAEVIYADIPSDYVLTRAVARSFIEHAEVEDDHRVRRMPALHGVGEVIRQEVVLRSYVVEAIASGQTRRSGAQSWFKEHWSSVWCAVEQELDEPSELKLAWRALLRLGSVLLVTGPDDSTEFKECLRLIDRVLVRQGLDMTADQMRGHLEAIADAARRELEGYETDRPS